jgi:hypothetical protein
MGLSRFVGLFSAAVWFGATLFFMLSVSPALVSQDMKELLGVKNFPYFSVAIGQVIVANYYRLFLACSVISMVHLIAEWLYFGKSPHRLWLVLLVGLWVGGASQMYAIQPKLKQFHRLQFTQPDPREREFAARSYRLWKGTSEACNVILLAGLGMYLWRLSNPSDRHGS